MGGEGLAGMETMIHTVIDGSFHGAYLDGERPSVVMCRGVYGRIVMAAWDWRGGQLSRRWVFDSGIGIALQGCFSFFGHGGHSLSVGDVDDDGRDEVVSAMTVDDGKGLYTTGRRTEIRCRFRSKLMLIVKMRAHVRFPNPRQDAATGKIWTHSPIDVGSGMAADVEVMRCGEAGMESSIDRHLPVISRPGRGGQVGGTKARKCCFSPCARVVRSKDLSGDILGDWREGFPRADQSISYTSTIPTRHEGRSSVSTGHWQNVVYNKPPHPSFYGLSLESFLGWIGTF